ncbi:MAG: SH3 domain-containing protein [Nostoc sp. NMS1]|uniref:SH3 domain-containing protein n=1 Tax=unclassified Nostoc TaxID=2593658 RepID=UPI0025F73A45|nr:MULTISPECIES: SH3 domain-containing protein [unclassified Nostoc]MBN3909118.1 SH3 domain-containing protein [Nostoc sp. NMS1]MBN3989738.1 SH3 domain-containing protein [Nostoc sp. NMS2]
MKIVRRFFGWFFLIIGAFGLFQQLITGLVFLSWGVLLLPSTNKLAAKAGLQLNLWKRISIVFIGIVLISSHKVHLQSPQYVTQQATPEPTSPISALNQPPKLNSPTKLETETPLPKSKESSIGALVQKKGLDFSYETAGRVEKSEKLIVVNYTRDWKCGVEALESTARQEWQTVFDLSTKTWTDKVRELNNCLGNANQTWIDYSTTPSQFSIEPNSNETVIRADVQDTDGSIILKDSLVVRYKAEDGVSLNTSPATSESSLTSTTFSQTSEEGVLVAKHSEAQINVRTGAGINFKSRHYGLVGDKVTIINSVHGQDSYIWYQIKFPISGADGWVRSDFIQVMPIQH